MGKGFDIPWVGVRQNTMGMGFKIPWVGDLIYPGQGVPYTMGKGFIIASEGLDIPWVGDPKYHG